MNEDRFASYLDQLAKGATPDDADPLAAFARSLHDKHETDRLDDEKRAAIWASLLSDHSRETPTTGGPGPLSQPALTDPATYNPWPARRRSGKHPRPSQTRLGVVNHGLQTGITAIAIVAVVIAAFSAFPQLQPDVMPEVTPTAFAAAPTTTGVEFGAAAPEPGTPDLLATPEPPTFSTPLPTYRPPETPEHTPIYPKICVTPETTPGSHIFDPEPAPPNDIPTVNPQPWGPEDCASMIPPPPPEVPAPPETPGPEIRPVPPTPVTTVQLNEESEHPAGATAPPIRVLPSTPTPNPD